MVPMRNWVIHETYATVHEETSIFVLINAISMLDKTGLLWYSVRSSLNPHLFVNHLMVKWDGKS